MKSEPQKFRIFEEYEACCDLDIKIAEAKKTLAALLIERDRYTYTAVAKRLGVHYAAVRHYWIELCNVTK